MQLVLIENMEVVKVYEDNCTEEQIDSLFDELEFLIRERKRQAPTVTLSGHKLDNWFQYQLQYLYNDLRAREEAKKKADRLLGTKAAILKNNLKAFFVNLMARWTKRKKKKSS